MTDLNPVDAMTNLSPAAQVVRRDFAQIMHELHQRCRVSVSATDTLPIILETNDASLQAGINSLCAAALRAAADQVAPSDADEPRNYLPMAIECQRIRKELLAIAADLELEGCCKWLPKLPPWSAEDLRKHRRPNPPSLKKQALHDLEALEKDLKRNGMGFGAATIRRALEQL